MLATQRSAKMDLPFKWEFPGGKVEQGEPAEESLIREIQEELDIGIKIIGNLDPQVHLYSEKAVRLIPFLCEIESGEICLKEHLAFKWLPPHELRDLDWAEADVPVVEQFINRQ